MSGKGRRLRMESIEWIAVADELPDAGTEVLVCYKRNDCEDRDVTVATYDDGYDCEGPWYALSVTLFSGAVLYWADMPVGPERADE